MSASTESTVAPPRPLSNAAVAQTAAPLRVYGWSFWCAYVANTTLMIAISLMYRYADFVLFLGGTEWTVGSIVGVGMIGSLGMRFLQGQGIDRLGPRRIWLWSQAGFTLSLLGHLFVTDAHGPAIYLLRMLYATSVAGVFGASLTSVSRSLPLARMAEVIGSLGTSAFIAMAIGPQLGDLLCGRGEITRGDLNWMFLVAAGLGVVSLVSAELSTRGQVPPRQLPRKPHLFWLLRRYHPGTLLVLGVVMGIGFVMPTTFLPAYIRELGIERTGPFFLTYAITAFIARLGTRRAPELIGVRPLILLGMVSLVISLACYLPATTEWGLMVPGAFAGLAHAVLFPSVQAQGAAAFPGRYRGLGTTLMLAMLDIGALVGAPMIGALVETSKQLNLSPYPTTFLVLGFVIVASGILYVATNRK